MNPTSTEVTAWAPATVANLNVGFDALGCALSAPGERITARRTEAHKGVRIVGLLGAGADGLSTDVAKNVAGVAAASLHAALQPEVGIDLVIEKDIKPGSGIGSSAASAVAAVVAVNGLLDAGLRPDELLPFALDGESLASGARHADNVAPALFGGLVLCPPAGRPRPVPVPAVWPMLILHPQTQIRTADARRVLPDQVPLSAAVTQAAWLGTFISACHDGDAETALFALEDHLVTPYRKALLPEFEVLRGLAFKHGARAGGISGSGPSTFWMGEEVALRDLAQSATAHFAARRIPLHTHLTTVSARGAHLLNP